MHEREISEGSELRADYLHRLSGRRHNFFIFQRIFDPEQNKKLPDLPIRNVILCWIWQSFAT
jgi:hypothetical protein